MQKKRSAPKWSNLEGQGLRLGQIATQRDLNLLILFATDSRIISSQLPKGKKELFVSFREEQQRINKKIALKYLRAYLREQIKTVNQMASYLRERQKEDKSKKQTDVNWRTPHRIANTKVVSSSDFQVTYDITDLNKKIQLLDLRLMDLRDMINDYEFIDYDRKHGSIFSGLKVKYKKKVA